MKPHSQPASCPAGPPRNGSGYWTILFSCQAIDTEAGQAKPEKTSLRFTGDLALGQLAGRQNGFDIDDAKSNS